MLASCTYQRFCLYTGHVSSVIKDLTKSIISYLQETHFKYKDTYQSLQWLSHVWLFATMWTEARQASLSITNSQSLLKLMSIESMMPSNHLILSSPSPTFNVSQHQISQSTPMSQLFASGGQSVGVSASASVLPMNIQDWVPLGWTGWISLQSKRLSSLLQHHSWKASILSCSAFFTVQLSHPYLTTGKTVTLTRWTFLGKVMSLLFIMLSRREGNGNPLQCSCLENPRDGGAWWAAVYGVAQSRTWLKRLSSSSSSRLVIPFLPRSKRLLVSWLQSPSAVILEPMIIKVFHCFHCFPICFPWSDGTAMPWS